MGGSSVAGPVTIGSGGSLNPGAINHGIGTLTNETVAVNTGATLNIDINSTDNDKLLSYNALTINGNISVNIDDGYNPENDTQWTIATVVHGTPDITSATVDQGFGIKVSGKDVILSKKLLGTIIILQ